MYYAQTDFKHADFTIYTSLLCIPFILMTACSEDAMDKELDDSVDTNEITTPEDDTIEDRSSTDEKDVGDKDGSTSCQNALHYIFNEQDGLINVPTIYL